MASILFIAGTTTLSGQTREKIELMYGNVWGRLYNPVRVQCDETPTITADGSHIDTLHASQLRWAAVSQDLLWSPLRHRLFVKDSLDDRYQGKIKFGDTIWVESPNPNINGKWVIHDLMNKAYRKGIDFLQTTGDGGLYNNNKLWSGTFKIISIYVINKGVNNYAPKVINPSLWLFRPSIEISAMSVSFNEKRNFVERSKDKELIMMKYLNIVHYNLESICECLHKNYVEADEKSWILRMNLHKNISDKKIDSIRSEIRKYDAMEKMYRKEIKKLNKKNYY
jgi:hypothetical protein